MSRIIKLLLALLLLCGLTATALAADLSVAGITASSEAYQRITEAHPGLDVHADSNPYYTTELLINALISGGFGYDIYTTNTNAFNVPRLIDKGYCADLSGNAEIVSLVEAMYPPIAAQVRRGEGVYGLPLRAYIDYVVYRQSAWLSLGLTEADVPRTFGDLLDFLDRWITDIQPALEEPYCVISAFDETLYTKDSYTQFLVDLLLERHIMQAGYAGEALRFSDPAFVALLERCRETGQRLYELEPEPNEGTPLFERAIGMFELPQLLPLTITAEQPPLIRMNVAILMLYADTEAQALAEEFALYAFDMFGPENQATLLQDCDPIEMPGLDEALAVWQGTVTTLEAQLAGEDLSADDRAELEDQLERARLIAADIASEGNRYLYTAEDLALYRAFGDSFYIQPLHVFSPGTEEGTLLKNLTKQYCEGAITAQQLVKRLDEMAWMIEMEGA